MHGHQPSQVLVWVLRSLYQWDLRLVQREPPPLQQPNDPRPDLQFPPVSQQLYPLYVSAVLGRFTSSNPLKKKRVEVLEGILRYPSHVQVQTDACHPVPSISRDCTDVATRSSPLTTIIILVTHFLTTPDHTCMFVYGPTWNCQTRQKLSWVQPSWRSFLLKLLNGIKHYLWNLNNAIIYYNGINSLIDESA